jgi:hypothetical protein
MGGFYEAYFGDAKHVAETCGFPLDYLDSEYCGKPISVCRVPKIKIQGCIKEITKYDIYKVAIVREVLQDHPASDIKKIIKIDSTRRRVPQDPGTKSKKGRAVNKKARPAGSGKNRAKGILLNKKAILNSYLSIKKEYPGRILLCHILKTQV